MRRALSPTGPAAKRRREGSPSQTSAYEEVFQLIRTSPPSVAEQLVRRLRNGMNADDLVRFVRDGDLLVNLALQPDHRFRYTLLYPADIRPLFHGKKTPYTSSNLFQKLFETGEGDRQGALMRNSARKSIYDIPYHAATVFDPLLSSANLCISRWTTASSDEKFLRRAFEIYFQFEYPSYHWFHKDLFLRDLIAGKSEHCSSLLVNAILSAACHGMNDIDKRSEFWNPDNPGFLFHTEAKRLLELDPDSNRLTTIQSLCIIGMTYSQNALDKIGWPLWDRSFAMAEEMRIFGNLEADRSLTDEVRLARGFTAWAVFNLASQTSFYFQRKPFWKAPPKSPLPDTKTISELWLVYPQIGVVVPHCFGLTFRALCQLHVIINIAMCQAIHEDQARSAETPTISFDTAAVILERLKQWKRQLPNPLSPKAILLPNHIMMHMLYNLITHKMYSSLLSVERRLNDSHRDMPFPDYTSFSPAAIVEQAQTNLIALSHMMYRAHGSEGWYTPLMGIQAHLVHTILPQIRQQQQQQQQLQSPTPPPLTKALRATVIMCVKGLWDQGLNTYIAETMFHMTYKMLDEEDAAIVSRSTGLPYHVKDRVKLMQQHSEATVTRKGGFYY